MKNVYFLCSCDALKTAEHAVILSAGESVVGIKRAILKQIREGVIGYKRGKTELSKEAQCEMVKKDFKSQGEQFVFDNLDFGLVQIFGDEVAS